MKILYIHQHFATPEGSSGTRSYEMAQAMIQNGHEVTMVCGQGSRSKSPLEGEYKKGKRLGNYRGINIIEFQLKYSNRDSASKRFLVFMKFAWRCTKLVFREKYDILFATTTPLTVAIPGIIMKIFKKKPFVFETRDSWPEGLVAVGVKNKPLLAFMEFLTKHGNRKADECIALSPGIGQAIQKRLKKEKPIHLIPNGCDTDLFVPGSANKSEHIPGYKEGDFVGIFTGAHGMANGLHWVLSAAKNLKERGDAEHIKFVFIGDGKLKPELVERAQKEGLDNCIFLDPVSKQDLVKVMQSADVGLMVLENYPEYYYGTSPNKFFDYLSTGLPVLNNYPGWLAEIIQEEKIGYAIEPENPELFANTMIKFSEDSDELSQMAKRSRQLAVDHYSRRALSNKLVRVLENVESKY